MQYRKKIFLANPHGFCAGVERAISIVENALNIYGTPIYVRHEVVHNKYIVDNFKQRGVIFIENIYEVPDNSVLIYSAHGVSKLIRNQAKNRNLIILDATCPLVTKIHMAASRASFYGKELILIGHSGHPEVEGTMGQYDNPKGKVYLIESVKDALNLKVKNKNNLSFITQTTLSLDETSKIISVLRKRFPNIVGPYKNNICYATTNRQKAVLKLSKLVDIILVIGSKNSSNSNRLAELASKMGKTTYLIEDKDDIQEKWVRLVKSIGITAGASAPNILVKNVIKHLKRLEHRELINMEGFKENIFFKLPKELIISS